MCWKACYGIIRCEIFVPLFQKCITSSVGWYPISCKCIHLLKLKYCLLWSVELSVDIYSTSNLLNASMVIYCTVDQLHDNHKSSNDRRPTKMICLQVICNYQQSTYDGNEQNHDLKRLKIDKIGKRIQEKSTVKYSSNAVGLHIVCVKKISNFITSSCDHFTYIEILWKVVKWSMKMTQWKNFVPDTPSFCDLISSHVELFNETFHIRGH